MLERKFAPEFEQAVELQAKSLSEPPVLEPARPEVRDLRALLWSSIDNEGSLDLDQIEYAEQLPGGEIRVMVGIADVDAFVPKGSPIDEHAYANCTSIYTGIETFPMLPEKLSTDLSSLKQDEERLAIVADINVMPDGSVRTSDVYRAVVLNRAALAYPMVGKWLDKGGSAPERIMEVPGLADQLMLQAEVKKRLHDLRAEHGALALHTIEARTVADSGRVIDLEVVEPNAARDIIENLMIAANVVVSDFLEAKRCPALRRVIKSPDRWDKIVEVARSNGVALPEQPDSRALSQFLLARKAADPLHYPDLSLTVVKLLGTGEYAVHVPGREDSGHFALAVHDYTHATAPNRRYADLVIQRLVKAVLAGKPAPYSLADLETVSLHCTRREHEAKKVERTMRKIAAAVLLSGRIGEKFDGIVTGVTDGGTFVRLLKPPAEGRIIKGEKGLDIGDKVKLRLLAANPENAWIDFACL